MRWSGNIPFVGDAVCPPVHQAVHELIRAALPAASSSHCSTSLADREQEICDSIPVQAESKGYLSFKAQKSNEAVRHADHPAHLQSPSI